MTSEEKFDKAHEILEKAITELKEIGFTRWAFAAFRPDSWVEKHKDIASQGLAATIHGSAHEIIVGMAYMYGMVCKDASKLELKAIREFTGHAFDAAYHFAQEHGEDEDVPHIQIKVSKAKAKGMTIEELIKMALEQAADEDEDEDGDED